MSSEAVVGAYSIPTCRRDEYLQVCIGPPSTAPHDIPLPEVNEAIQEQHDKGHHETPSDSPSRCKICRAIAHHIQSCSTCLATFIRCVRNDCQAAWNPLEALVIPIATKLGRRCTGMTHAFVDEAISVATAKGMELIFAHPSCDPEAIIKDGRGITGLLWTAMWNKVKDFIKKEHPTAEVLVFDHGDDEPFTIFETRDIEGARVASDDLLDEISSRDTVAILMRIIVDYLDTLNPEDQYIFHNWYAKATEGAGSTQQEIGLHLGMKQSQISRRIKAFKSDLAALFDDPTTGLDDETRACARSLFLATELTRQAKQARRSSRLSTSSIDDSDPTSHDCGAAPDYLEPTPDDSEGHNE